MKFGNLEVVYASGPAEYEWLTMEILLEGEPIIVIDQEKGIDFLEAELFGTDENFRVKVTLPDLINALLEIKKAFAEMPPREPLLC
jgi:hypothetical protein